MASVEVVNIGGVAFAKHTATVRDMWLKSTIANWQNRGWSYVSHELDGVDYIIKFSIVVKAKDPVPKGPGVDDDDVVERRSCTMM